MRQAYAVQQKTTGNGLKRSTARFTGRPFDLGSLRRISFDTSPLTVDLHGNRPWSDQPTVALRDITDLSPATGVLRPFPFLRGQWHIAASQPTLLLPRNELRISPWWDAPCDARRWGAGSDWGP